MAEDPLMELLQAMVEAEAETPGNTSGNSIRCKCGGILDQTTPGTCYGNCAGCDGCGRTIEKFHDCFHCSRGRCESHPSGYDLCMTCVRKKQNGGSTTVTSGIANAAPTKTELLPNPLQSVKCRCNRVMDFIPVHTLYNGVVKCDGCSNSMVPNTFMYHCRYGKSSEHRTTHDQFDYCFSCAYSRFPTLATTQSNNRDTESSSHNQTIRNLRTNVQRLQESIQSKNSEVSILQDQIASLRTSARNANTSGNDKADIIEQLKDELMVKRQKVQELESSVDRFRDKLTTRNEEMQTLKNNTDSIQVINVELYHRIQELESETKGAQFSSAAVAEKPIVATVETGIQTTAAESQNNSISTRILSKTVAQPPSQFGSEGVYVKTVLNELLSIQQSVVHSLAWLASGGFKDPNQPEQKEEECGALNTLSISDLENFLTNVHHFMRLQQHVLTTAHQLLSACQKSKEAKNVCWMQWNHDEIVNWIVSLGNGQLRTYEQTLRTEMRKAGFKGHHLSTLNLVTLPRFGIQSWDDSNFLLAEIEKLTNPNPNPNPMNPPISQSNPDLLRNMSPPQQQQQQMSLNNSYYPGYAPPQPGGAQPYMPSMQPQSQQPQPQQYAQPQMIPDMNSYIVPHLGGRVGGYVPPLHPDAPIRTEGGQFLVNDTNPKEGEGEGEVGGYDGHF